ncbi:uncharacterized protein BDR25DRAFT_243076 [Lindgomyces ingoldianus]|uniref:Uncharacterized protein n=1 Tax=Lindgomyces ingoldianus TaxID=673940 RepID=A0ACB6QB48_9PLEO|nr:uncharacterized protein BDR25DRAFT_243076 [Lindgomyces ingoldianus]KAF2464154.1 hypothetical protein BDR25DRAFT_243076 [Lindgomyces ingoldianus]
MPTFRFQAPLEELFLGEWFMIRSSNGFRKDKRNVRCQYTATASHIEDEAFYQTVNSDTVKSVVGKDTACEGNVGVYSWQGKGLLRVASARWEDWMLVFAHQSIFTSAAINLMCRSQDGLNEEDMRLVEGWLSSVAENKFRQIVSNLADIKQE